MTSPLVRRLSSEHVLLDGHQDDHAQRCDEFANKQAAGRRQALASLEDESRITRLLWTAVPLFFSGVQFVFVKMTDTALAGHVDAKYLHVTAFSDFWTQLYSMLTASRVLGTLAAPAVGAEDYQLVGAYLQTALVVLFVLMVPVIALNCLTSPVLQQFGIPPSTSDPAAYYAIVLSLCLPPRIIMRQVSQFLVAQECADIPSSVSFIPPILNFLFGVQFVLGVPLAAYGFGFFACPWVTVAVEYLGLLAVFFAMHTAGAHRNVWRCWPAKSVLDRAHFAQAIAPKVRPFLDMHLPQVAALSSDFWRFSAIGWMSSWPSINGAGVFNAGYRIAWLNMTLTSSLSTAGNMVIGAALGRGDGPAAERVFWKVSRLIVGVLVVSSATWVVFAEQIAVVFTAEPKFADDFKNVSVSFSVFVFTMNLSVALESFLITLKRNREVLRATVIGSWLGQVPATFLLLTLVGLNLNNVYWGVSIGYLILCALYGAPLAKLDWDHEARMAQEFMRV